MFETYTFADSEFSMFPFVFGHLNLNTVDGGIVAPVRSGGNFEIAFCNARLHESEASNFLFLSFRNVTHLLEIFCQYV